MGGLLCLLKDQLHDVDFKFFINISGFIPRNKLHGEMFEKLVLEDSIRICIPSMHVYGKTDILVDPERTLALAKAFKDPVIVEHKGGHFVPSQWPLHQIADFVVKLLLESIQSMLC